MYLTNPTSQDWSAAKLLKKGDRYHNSSQEGNGDYFRVEKYSLIIFHNIKE